MEPVEHLSDAAVTFQARPSPGGEDQVLPHGHVWEERIGLGDVATKTAARRKLDVGGGVEEDGVIEQDAAGIGVGEAGDGFEKHGLTGSVAAVDGGCAGADGEIDLERETRRDTAANANVGHWWVCPSCSRRLET